MKCILVIVLVSVALINAVQEPCGRDSNVKKCLCKNRRTYYQTGAGNIRIRCPENSNPVKSCTCTDGSTWEAPTTLAPPRPDATTKGPPRPDPTRAPPSTGGCSSEEAIPCGRYSDVERCTCKNGRSYYSRRDLLSKM